MSRKEFLRIIGRAAGPTPPSVRWHEKGVRYEDEAAALRDILISKSTAPEPGGAKEKDHSIEL